MTPFHGNLCRDAIMKFNEQDRSSVVTLSAAKGLARWAQRCFAALSMTFPVLVGKFHHRVRPCSRYPNADAINRVLNEFYQPGSALLADRLSRLGPVTLSEAKGLLDGP